MAVDSLLKRKAASGVPFLPLGPGVVPDADEPLVWRQTAAWGYPIQEDPVGNVMKARFLAVPQPGFTAEQPHGVGFLSVPGPSKFHSES